MKYDHMDRCMIEAEQSLWVAREALCLIEHSGQFSDRIANIRTELEAVAKEMRAYNDQLEEEP